jgi:hypothetical protein
MIWKEFVRHHLHVFEVFLIFVFEVSASDNDLSASFRVIEDEDREGMIELIIICGKGTDFTRWYEYQGRHILTC